MEKEEIRIEFTKKLLDMGFVKSGDFELTKRMDSRRMSIYFRGIGIFVEFSSTFNVVSSMCVPYEHTKGDFNILPGDRDIRLKRWRSRAIPKRWRIP